jgi:8-oxo-dGTP diphosphatase
MTEVRFFDKSYTPETKLIYSVIAAKYCNNWIYVRHRGRDSWEIPGGHIEENESPDQTAARELGEETGAIEFTIKCVATYCVIKDGTVGYGRLYYAKIDKIGPVPDVSEIDEVEMVKGLPDNLTYPDIQPVLFNKVERYLKGEVIN